MDEINADIDEGASDRAVGVLLTKKDHRYIFLAK